MGFYPNAKWDEYRFYRLPTPSRVDSLDGASASELWVAFDHIQAGYEAPGMPPQPSLGTHVLHRYILPGGQHELEDPVVHRVQWNPQRV